MVLILSAMNAIDAAWTVRGHEDIYRKAVDKSWASRRTLTFVDVAHNKNGR